MIQTRTHGWAQSGEFRLFARPDPPPGPPLRWRLSALMFLVYAAPGAVIPQLAVHLKEIGFTPAQIGAACATQAFGALLAPLLVGQIADRWARADRCLAVCAFTASLLLWLLPGCTDPGSFFGLSLAFWLVMAPAMTLTTSICFAHLRDPGREFGPVRLWGTVGWVVSCWLLGWWFSRPAGLYHLLGQLGVAPAGMSDLFRLASLMALLLGLYALTLPATPPSQQCATRLATVDALRLLRRRSFAVYLVCYFGLCLTMAFSSQTTPLLLDALGLPRHWLGPVLTIAQSTEVVALAILPLLLARWGQRRVMILGATAWATALAVLTIGHPTALVVGSLGLHGLFIACFLVAGQMYVNSQATSDIRVSAQALVTFTSALGLLTGNLLAGWVRGQVGGWFAPTFGVATVIAFSSVAIFLAGFRQDRLPAPDPDPVEADRPAFQPVPVGSSGRSG
jgi:MFS family permease